MEAGGTLRGGGIRVRDEWGSFGEVKVERSVND